MDNLFNVLGITVFSVLVICAISIFFMFAAVGAMTNFFFKTMGYFYARQTYHMLYRIGQTYNIEPDMVATIDAAAGYFQSKKSVMAQSFCKGIHQYINEMRELNAQLSRVANTDKAG